MRNYLAILSKERTKSTSTTAVISTKRYSYTTQSTYDVDSTYLAFQRSNVSKIAEKDCFDKSSGCSIYSMMGLCKSGSKPNKWMVNNCIKTCDLCKTYVFYKCRDSFFDCIDRKLVGIWTERKTDMKRLSTNMWFLSTTSKTPSKFR